MEFAEYWVTLLISDVEARSLDAATEVEYDDRLAGVIIEDPSEGVALIACQIRAPAHEEPSLGTPHREAMDVYAKLQRNASLEVNDKGAGVVTSYSLGNLPTMSVAELAALPPPPATRRPARLPYERLLLKARNLHAQGRTGQAQYDAATVFAHAACEVAITDAMGRLMEAHASGLKLAMEGLLGKSRYSLTDSRAAALWDALASDKINKADFWAGYLDHHERRNGVVHAGQSVSREQALESIEVAQELCEHVTTRYP